MPDDHDRRRRRQGGVDDLRHRRRARAGAAHRGGGALNEGWIDPAVAGEFPDLRLWEEEVEVAPGRSDEGVRRHLRLMSERFTGAQAVAMRSQPIHHAHRVFFRHIGLDPDRDRPPAESLAVERLMHGGFPSRGRILDAITIAVMETGVGVWALDAERVSGELGIRTAFDGEEVGLVPLPRGRLVVADAARCVAVLFGDIAPDLLPTSATQRTRLFALQVAGVPSIHVEEAMWLAVEAM